jgi:hypothetical protein
MSWLRDVPLGCLVALRLAAASHDDSELELDKC